MGQIQARETSEREVIVITGASAGIGRTAALLTAAAGLTFGAAGALRRPRHG